MTDQLHRSGPGARIYARIPRIPSAIIFSLSRHQTTALADAMGRFGAMQPGIRPLAPQMRVAGPAITIRTWPGSNSMVWHALKFANAGDVLVVETRDNRNASVWGEVLSGTAVDLRLAGVVTDGMVRDIPAVIATGLPVFAIAGSCPAGAQKGGPGEINVPISVGGVPILPGDLIFGDDHGVVVVPRHDAEAVLLRAEQMMQRDAALRALDKEQRIASILKPPEVNEPAVYDAVWPGTES